LLKPSTQFRRFNVLTELLIIGVVAQTSSIRIFLGKFSHPGGEQQKHNIGFHIHTYMDAKSLSLSVLSRQIQQTALVLTIDTLLQQLLTSS
jgi:hypothetical protein